MAFGVPVRRALAYALTGIVIGAHPMLAPALTLFHRASWTLSWRDVPWGAAAALYAALSVVHRGLDWNLPGVLLAWVVFRLASDLGHNPRKRSWLTTGVALGAALLVAWSLVQVVVLVDARASGPPWIGHPNLLAHVLLVVIIVPLAWSERREISLAAAALGLVGLLLTGSRSGLLGGVVLLTLTAPSLLLRARALLPVALLAGLVIGFLAFREGATISRFLTLPAMPSSVESSKNLFAASEDLGNGAVWGRFGVTVDPLSDQEAPAEWLVTRTDDTAAARPQQFVTLVPERRYVFAAEIQGGRDAAPGLLAWGADEAGASEVRVWLGSHGARAEGGGRVEDVVAGSSMLDDSWTRVWVAFTVRGPGPLGLAFGPSPDLASDRPMIDVSVRALQLEVGEVPSTYVATEAVSGAREAALGEAVARFTHWRVALDGISARPWFGWGYDTFGAYAFTDGRATDRPRHPHNQVLSSAFEGGAVGVIALACVILAIAAGGALSRSTVIALLLANAFDTTLLSTFVLFPLALLAGLERAAGGGVPATASAAARPRARKSPAPPGDREPR